MGISDTTRAQVRELFDALHQAGIALRQVADGSGSATAPGRIGVTGVDAVLAAVATACSTLGESPAPEPPAPAPSTVPVTVLQATTSPALTGNSTTEVYTSNPQGGLARVGSFVVGTEAIFELQHPNTTDSGAMLAFDAAAGLPTTTNTQDYVAQIIPSGAVYQSANSTNSMVVPNFTLPAGPTARMRLRMASTGVVTVETQNDGASSWVVRHTFGVTATAGTTYHARMYCTWSASQRRIYQPRVSGITLT